MEQPDVMAQMQVLETFHTLAPLLDPSLKLTPNPNGGKRPRKGAPKEQESTGGEEGAKALQVLPLLKMMSQLLIRHDQELSNLRKMDQFIFFLSRDKTGALQHLLSSTGRWRQQVEAASMAQMPLRQFLTMELLHLLRQRWEKLMESQDTEQLFLTSVEKGVILQDRSFPFHRWDPIKQQLYLDKKTPISGTLMGQHLAELEEMVKDQTLIQQFHALKPSSDPEIKIIPWRMQLNLRADRPYELMLRLSYNSVWMLIGATLKPHSQGQSGLAHALQRKMNPRMAKGQGRGKGKAPAT